MLNFVACRSGHFTLSLAIMLPVLGLSLGAAVDYAHLQSTRSALQAVADGAALNAAKELRLAGVPDSTLTAVARDFVEKSLPDRTVQFTDALSPDRSRYAVHLTQMVEPYLLPKGVFQGEVAVDAEARIYGGAPVCLLSLMPRGKEAISIETSKITAKGCAVYSNSRDPKGLVVKKQGQLVSGLTCSAGGVSAGAGTVSPTPREDCPTAPDPLRSRPTPAVGACDHQDFVAVGLQTLFPGVYCGGIHVDRGASVTFTAGTYILKDGPLIVSDETVVQGEHVGFFLTGEGAKMDIKPKTTVRLVAPRDGPMAGMLVYEDPANKPVTHKINSRDAPLLLGTFYLPASRLDVGAPGGYGALTDTIGAQSSWTIVVAQQISINDGLDLVLNADYGETTIPVPDGFGLPNSVSLTK